MRIMSLMLLSTLAAASLAGCASIPLKTVYNLWNFDPWSSDFRIWRAAVRVPEGRGIDLNTAKVRMKVESWREGDATRTSEVFVLERSLDPADLAPLAAEKRPGFALATYRIAAADYARMDALRTQMLAAKKSGAPQKGKLSISATSCGGAKGVPIEGAYPFSTYLMVEAKDGYNPLLVDYDLGPDLRKVAKNPSAEPLCAPGR